MKMRDSAANLTTFIWLVGWMFRRIPNCQCGWTRERRQTRRVRCCQLYQGHPSSGLAGWKDTEEALGAVQGGCSVVQTKKVASSAEGGTGVHEWYVSKMSLSIGRSPRIWWSQIGRKVRREAAVGSSTKPTSLVCVHASLRLVRREDGRMFCKTEDENMRTRLGNGRLISQGLATSNGKEFYLEPERELA